MITIAVDAMGGDVGLCVTVPAAVAFLQRQPDAHLIMVGDELALVEGLTLTEAPMQRISIRHTTELVEMDEPPQLALKNKKDSSLRVAIDLVKDGQAQAAVSAGNTGALMATARFVLKTLPGIDRPAIAKFLPAQNNSLTCVLDLGGNVDCTAEQIMQFGIMGSELVKTMLPEKHTPRVGLLNIGSEDIKGNKVVKEAYALLRQTDLNFIGNVEGNDIFSGEVDVVATDGFVGNVTLKAVEGAVKMVSNTIKAEFERTALTKLSAMAALPVLKGFKRRLDPRRFNGAIFLGLRGVVVKSHGGTDAVGFNYALQEAYQEVHADILTKLAQGVAQQLAKVTLPEAAETEADAGSPQ